MTAPWSPPPERVHELPAIQAVPTAHLQLDPGELASPKGEPLLRHITRQTRAMPQYHVGHKDRIARIHHRLENFPTLALAGSSLSGVGVPGCIESGQKAAERIATALHANPNAIADPASAL